MSSTERDELLVAVEELRVLFPDWRLGQLVANLALAAGHGQEQQIWEVEDAALLEAARRLIDRNRHRKSLAVELAD